MAAIALLGAGGKMGHRLARNLMGSPHELRPIEVGQAGLERLAELGLQAVPRERALDGADIVILAVPDRLIKAIADEIVPMLRPGAMVIILDPAAPHAGHLPKRSDVTYFVTHPCHPPVVNDETEPAAKRDFFGRVAARQNIVCALMQGPEADYARGEEIALPMFAPMMRAPGHRRADGDPRAGSLRDGLRHAPDGAPRGAG